MPIITTVGIKLSRLATMAHIKTSFSRRSLHEVDATAITSCKVCRHPPPSSHHRAFDQLKPTSLVQSLLFIAGIELNLGPVEVYVFVSYYNNKTRDGRLANPDKRNDSCKTETNLNHVIAC